MIGFAVLFLVLVFVFIVWFFTISRRLKGKGLQAMDEMIVLPIDKAQILALSTNLGNQISRHQQVYSTIGYTRGLRDLHHNAACLIEAWSSCAPEGYDEEERDLNKRLNGMGLCVGLALLECTCSKVLHSVFGFKMVTVPVVHATLAVSLYAEIQARIRSLYEGLRPDLLVVVGSKI